jgi:phosphopantothenoylcysteine decarboxylase/phosphopantothenate--cysteine ligase
MKILQDKKIVLGITGGIAAYKAPELVRRLKDQGATVRVVLTNSGKAFVSPLSLQAVSGYAVAESLLDPQAELAMGHIELAKWADLILIAPATANIVAKLAQGIADDLLTTLCLATQAPIAIAPAMNQQMWHAAATQDNITRLTKRHVIVLGPDAGEQACGDVGLGRMLEVEKLVMATEQCFIPKILSGQHWVITAGPTREAIDPVRYISNHSSGKMGYALAQAATNAGARVSLISGPVNLTPPQDVNVINVTSALEMHQQSMALAPEADVFIACAAVADYRVDNIATQKIKKTIDNDTLQLNLVKNPDIVADVAKLANKPFTVGFAAETQNVAQYAQQKLLKKNLDLIAANDVAQKGQGFNSDSNALVVFNGEQQFVLPLAPKPIIATQLVSLISTQNVNIKLNKKK